MIPAAAYGKIYLCGSKDSGKTTLCHTLQRTWRRRPHVETGTRGIDVSEFSSKGSKRKNKKKMTLSVWDISGPQAYHLVHNAFLPALGFSEEKEATISQGKATTFVLVCSSRYPEDVIQRQLDYWLRYIASSYHETTKQLPQVFVVLNNIGGAENLKRGSQDCQNWELLVKEKRDKFSGVLDVHADPFVLDVRKRTHVKGLKTCLLDHFRKLLKEQEVPEICDAIRRNLPIWSEARKKFPVLQWAEFLDEVEQLSGKLPQQTILSATKYLSEAGVLIYIDKSFPSHWGILYRRLIILNPNWFCKEIIGNILLSRSILSDTESDHFSSKEVDATTGFISMPGLQRFFKSALSDEQLEDLSAILLWLGFYYKTKDGKAFIPSLIKGNVEPGDPWQSQSSHVDGEEQWVMGFSIDHQKNGLTLAPMCLWHRFQVQVAQTPKFNNDFVAGEDFVKFTVDYMYVRIELHAEEDCPTFDEISFYVKPNIREDHMCTILRKQCQVNMANDVVHVLTGLWNEICGGVQYVHRVVWPWPVSQSRPASNKDRSMEVAQVKKSVQMYGMGRKVQWPVGLVSEVTDDQLLSTKDKMDVIWDVFASARKDVNVLGHGLQEAVNLRIYPHFEELEISLDGNNTEEAALGSDGIERATPRTSPTVKNLLRLSTVKRHLHEMEKKLEKMEENVEDILRDGFAETVNEQKRAFRQLQETQLFFNEDERTCPNLIYLGERGSDVWVTLERALSSTEKVGLRFACEAMFNNYRPHAVKDQRGLDFPGLKLFLKKIVPCLKVSLAVFLISAKMTTVAAPLPGLLPQANSLLDGIVSATGFSMPELDELMTEGMGFDPSDPRWNPLGVYKKSRAAITNLIGKLTPEDYETNFGLTKVCLLYDDRSPHGDVWICNDCHQEFSKSQLVRDI